MINKKETKEKTKNSPEKAQILTVSAFSLSEQM